MVFWQYDWIFCFHYCIPNSSFHSNYTTSIDIWRQFMFFWVFFFLCTSTTTIHIKQFALRHYFLWLKRRHLNSILNSVPEFSSFDIKSIPPNTFAIQYNNRNAFQNAFVTHSIRSMCIIDNTFCNTHFNVHQRIYRDRWTLRRQNTDGCKSSFAFQLSWLIDSNETNFSTIPKRCNYIRYIVADGNVSENFRLWTGRYDFVYHDTGPTLFAANGIYNCKPSSPSAPSFSFGNICNYRLCPRVTIKCQFHRNSKHAKTRPSFETMVNYSLRRRNVCRTVLSAFLRRTCIWNRLLHHGTIRALSIRCCGTSCCSLKLKTVQRRHMRSWIMLRLIFWIFGSGVRIWIWSVYI